MAANWRLFFSNIKENIHMLRSQIILGGSILTIICLSFSFLDRSGSPYNQAPFPYDLSQPQKSISLPEKLTEISGLTYVSPGKLAVVQDEKAHIYQFDLEKEKIITDSDFGKSGDYEGVELVGETAYVVNSEGEVFEVPDYTQEDSPAKVYNTVLSDNNNVEGLGYFPQNDYLLLACKGSPNLDRKLYSGYRSIYAFDLRRKKLNPAPFLLVNKQEIGYVLERQAKGAFEKAYAKSFDPSDKDAFRPSGIAVHPQSMDIYVLGSVGKMLLVYRKDGKLLYAQPLDKRVFKQPEGICFSPEGELYISNEGRNGKGNILIFPQGS